MVGAEVSPRAGAANAAIASAVVRRRVGERDRAGARGAAEQAAAGGGPVGRRVAEGHVRAAARR